MPTVLNPRTRSGLNQDTNIMPKIHTTIKGEEENTPDTLKMSAAKAIKKKKIKKAEYKFAKMIIISSIIFIAVRLFDLTQTVIYRLSLIGLFKFDNATLALIRSLNIIIIYSSYSAGFFIYLYFDKNFANVLTGYVILPLKLCF